MSIEFFGTPVPALTAYSIRKVLDAITEFDDITVVRRDESELGIGFPENENSEVETATIGMRSGQVHVGFHACPRDQQSRVIRFLESTLRGMGCACQLREE